LRGYLDTFAQIYGDSDLESVLRDQIDVLERAGDRLPRVFLHGDPGTWNMLATRDGRVAFLDWESAEVAGLPLWDLFYFLRSYGLTRLRGHVPTPLAAFDSAYFGSSDLTTWVHEQIAAYCRAVELHPDWVVPLYYTCWMHRSLKEATRLERSRLGTGHFINVLRRARQFADLEAQLLPAHGRG
jgi:thiamine kinase-like enzyme